MKANDDPSSKNLYVSNLPKNMNEVGLAAVFMGYNLVSSKIWHDSEGNSCGFGFAW
jgi:RNA recognition motif-containing protein